MTRKVRKPDQKALNSLWKVVDDVNTVRAGVSPTQDVTPDMLRVAIESVQKVNNLTIAETANQLGMTQSHLSGFYNGTRALGTATLKSLGLEKRLLYVRRWR